MKCNTIRRAYGIAWQERGILLFGFLLEVLNNQFSNSMSRVCGLCCHHHLQLHTRSWPLDRTMNCTTLLSCIDCHSNFEFGIDMQKAWEVIVRITFPLSYPIDPPDCVQTPIVKYVCLAYTFLTQMFWIYLEIKIWFCIDGMI